MLSNCAQYRDPDQRVMKASQEIRHEMTRRRRILPRRARPGDRAVSTRSRHRQMVHHAMGADLGQPVSVGEHESRGIPDERFLSLADCMLNPPEPPAAKTPSEREARFLLHYSQR